MKIMKIFFILLILLNFVSCNLHKTENSNEVKSVLVNPIQLQDAKPLMISNKNKVNAFKQLDQIPFEYTAQKVDGNFLSELEKMSLDSFNALWDCSNFFEIGNHKLYYITQNITGSSQVYIENQYGERELILDSIQPIYQIKFWDKEHLAIEFASQIHYEGYTGKTYIFNLKNSELTPLENGETGKGLGSQYTLYYQQLFYFNESKKSENLDEAYDVFAIAPDGNKKQILEYAPFAHFNGGKIYYTNSDKMQLLSCSLDGNDKEVICNFDEPLIKIEVHNKHIYCENEKESYVISLIDNKNKIVCNGKVFFDSDGFYCLNNNNEIEYIKYSGEKTILITNIPNNSIGYIGNKTIYLQVSNYYFKVDINNGNLILLN
ncbi:MAG: hypothetical protein RSD67_01175 [Oscillospiraceae bacterium]